MPNTPTTDRLTLEQEKEILEWMEVAFDDGYNHSSLRTLKELITNLLSQAREAGDASKVNRVEVIDEKGRSYVNWKKEGTVEVRVSLQDEDRTLKVFISPTQDTQEEVK